MISIVEPDPRWPGEFDKIASRLHEDAGTGVVRIDHIGSTSVPGLPSKDVIDVQITVANDESIEVVATRLAARSWRRQAGFIRDHHVPGLPTAPAEWRKALVVEPEGERRANVHIRVQGRANQHYALLFRDYLRSHPDAAEAYAQVKRELAVLAPDIDHYADAKDPVCDLIYFAAEAWAKDHLRVP